MKVSGWTGVQTHNPSFTGQRSQITNPPCYRVCYIDWHTYITCHNFIIHYFFQSVFFQDMEVNPFELQKSLNDGLKKGMKI